MSFINNIPNELGFQILSHLNFENAANCCRINQSWHKLLTTHNEFWKLYFPEILFPLNTHVKNYINSLVIVSEEQITQRYHTFAKDLLMSQNGTFTCLFPKSPKDKLKAELIFNAKLIGFPTDNLTYQKQASPDLNVTCIFMKAFNVNEENYTQIESIFNPGKSGLYYDSSHHQSINFKIFQNLPTDLTFQINLNFKQITLALQPVKNEAFLMEAEKSKAFSKFIL